MEFEILIRKGKGRNPVCPVCSLEIEPGVYRIEIYVFGSQSRQFHFACAKSISNRILRAIELEEEGGAYAKATLGRI